MRDAEKKNEKYIKCRGEIAKMMRSEQKNEKKDDDEEEEGKVHTEHTHKSLESDVDNVMSCDKLCGS